MKHIYYFIMILVVGVVLTACYDKDNTIHRIPDLVIENVKNASVQTGEIIDITPVCTMGGEEVECTYNWYRYHDTVPELISQDARLQWRVDTTDNVTLEVEATHVETGLQAVLAFSYTINPRSNNGWLILKETADGNTDMDVSLIQNGNIEFAADQLSLSLGEPMEGKPISILYTKSFKWYNPETGKTEASQKCLIPVSEKDILMYRVNDENILVKKEDLFYEMPDFASGSIEAFMSHSSFSGLIYNGKAYLMNSGLSAFMPALMGDYYLAPYIVCWGYGYSMLVYDEQNCSFAILPKSKSSSITMEIKYFKDIYRPEDDLKISSNQLDADLIYLGQTDKKIAGEYNWGTAYALMRKKGDMENLQLYGLHSQEFDAADYAPIRFARTIPVSRCRAFANADFYTMHQTSNIIYFIKDNRLSYYDIDEDKFVMDIHAFDGEITYCKYIANNYDYNDAEWMGDLYDNRFDRLIVATSSGTDYAIYSFDSSVDGLKLLPEIIRGKGKVRFMFWYSPAWSLFNSIYRYS